MYVVCVCMLCPAKLRTKKNNSTTCTFFSSFVFSFVLGRGYYFSRLGIGREWGAGSHRRGEVRRKISLLTTCHSRHQSPGSEFIHFAHHHRHFRVDLRDSPQHLTRSHRCQHEDALLTHAPGLELGDAAHHVLQVGRDHGLAQKHRAIRNVCGKRNLREEIKMSMLFSFFYA